GRAETAETTPAEAADAAHHARRTNVGDGAGERCWDCAAHQRDVARPVAGAAVIVGPADHFDLLLDRADRAGANAEAVAGDLGGGKDRREVAGEAEQGRPLARSDRLTAEIGPHRRPAALPRVATSDAADQLVVEVHPQAPPVADCYVPPGVE